MLTPEDRKLLDELDACEKLATPGEWKYSPKTTFGNTPLDAADVIGPQPAAREWGGTLGRYLLNDSSFIALSRNSARPLIELVRRLEAENERLSAERSAAIQQARSVCENCDRPDSLHLADVIEKRIGNLVIGQHQSETELAALRKNFLRTRRQLDALYIESLQAGRGDTPAATMAHAMLSETFKEAEQLETELAALRGGRGV